LSSLSYKKLIIQVYSKGKIMHTRLNTQIGKVVFGLILVVIVLFVSFGIIGSPVAHAQQIATPEPGQYYTLNTVKLANGPDIQEIIINGPPAPPAGFDVQRNAAAPIEGNSAAGIHLLEAPAFKWVFGCSAVSGAMIAGYYDRSGWPNMYAGPTNGGVIPLDDNSWPTWTDSASATYPGNPLIASKNGLDGRTTRGSIDDYWIAYQSTLADPFITNGWIQHTWGTAIGDYMKTSQSSFTNTDGSTMFYTYTSVPNQLTCATMAANSLADGTLGRKLFYEARGYTVTDCYNQRTDNTVAGGFSLAQFRAEIDAGRPVMLNLLGHTIVGVGYDDTSSTIYIHDTWDNNNHTMTWGTSYSGMALNSVSIVNLQAPARIISGNAGIGAVTLSYTDGTAKTATADSAGLYTFTVPSGWTGTVTPSLAGYTFTPASKSYTNLLADQTGQDYTANLIPPSSYTISGNAGVAAATLSYTDGTAKTATADNAGLYTFTVPSGWTGTVTPSLAGYTFTPASKSYTNLLADQTGQDYTANLIPPSSYTISGNAGVGAAILSYTDGTPKTATADNAGLYTFTVPSGWTGTVTPSLTGYTFTPDSKSYTNLLADQIGQDYVANLIPPSSYTISGNAGIAAATLSYTDGTAKTVVADANGLYTFTVPSGWTGTVTPSLPGYAFAPINTSYANVLADQLTQNYTATNIAIPVTIAPSGTTTLSTPTYSWSKITGATQYQYQLYSGATLVYTQTVASSACGSTANCVNTPVTVLPYAAYTWKVRSMTGGVWQPFSAAQAFSVINVISTLVAPTGITTDTTPTYSWSKVSGATQYQYQLYKGTTLVYTITVATSACGSTANCVNTPAPVLAYAAYTWKVRAMTGGVWQAFSAAKAFTIAAIPTTVAPDGTTTDTTPTFSWSKITGATQYQYQLYKGAALVYSQTVAASACGSTVNCVNTPTTVLAYAAYTWKARAMTGGIWQAFSVARAFTIAAIPTAITPSGKITDTTPTYTWTKITGASQYQYQLYQGTTLVYTQTVAAGACGATANCVNTPTKVLTAGAYTWKVRVMIGGIWQAFSPVKAFTLP
jgi:hypothetical protein